jgi:hypothetical protein
MGVFLFSQKANGEKKEKVSCETFLSFQIRKNIFAFFFGVAKT